MRPTLAIGHAYGTPRELIERSEIAVHDLLGIATERRRLVDVAGPKEVIQWISAPPVLAVIKNLFCELLERAGNDIGRNKGEFVTYIRDRLPRFEKVASIAHAAKRADAAFVFTVSPEPSKFIRGIGVDVTGDGPEEIAWKMFQLGRHAAQVQKTVDRILAVEKPPNFDKNPDISIKILIDDDGNAFLQWRRQDQTKQFGEPPRSKTLIEPDDDDRAPRSARWTRPSDYRASTVRRPTIGWTGRLRP